jgi:hypothetical protein
VDNSERKESFILSRASDVEAPPAAKPQGVGCKAESSQRKNLEFLNNNPNFKFLIFNNLKVAPVTY